MMATMRYRRELVYEAAPEDVFAMLADPAFRERVGDAQGVASIDVTLTREGPGFSVVIDTLQDTAGLPAIARKIAGDTTQAVVREQWADATGGTVEITAPGKPTKAVGTVGLSPSATGTTYVLELDVTVKVPLIGAKLEKVMADNIEQGLSAEHSVGTAWLKGER